MPRVVSAAFLVLAFAIAAPAFAQPRPPARTAAPSRPKPQRFWLNISAGAQTAPGSFHDVFDLPLYTEKEHIAVDYPSKGAVLVAASGGYRIWKQLLIGLGVTQSSGAGNARVSAQLPHPFLDNTYRTIEGTTRTTRDETGGHLLFGTIVPVSKKSRVMLTAGPSVLSVTQRIVTDVTFGQTYPYDTASFVGTTADRKSRVAAGFNAAADLSWMFSRSTGAGVLVQYTHARIRANAGEGRSVSFDGGGVQTAGGVRFAF